MIFKVLPFKIQRSKNRQGGGTPWDFPKIENHKLNLWNNIFEASPTACKVFNTVFRCVLHVIISICSLEEIVKCINWNIQVNLRTKTFLFCKLCMKIITINSYRRLCEIVWITCVKCIGNLNSRDHHGGLITSMLCYPSFLFPTVSSVVSTCFSRCFYDFLRCFSCFPQCFPCFPF